jgi:hypothetical protein
MELHEYADLQSALKRIAELNEEVSGLRRLNATSLQQYENPLHEDIQIL